MVCRATHMLLSPLTFSVIGIAVVTILTWFLQLRERKAMSEEDEGKQRVEMTPASHSRGEAVSNHHRQYSPRQNDSNHMEEEEECEGERVVIQTVRSGEEEDDDSGISELPYGHEEHLLDPPGRRIKRETLWDVCIQVFIPFMIAGFGMLAAGLLLDAVQVGIKYHVNSQCGSSDSLILIGAHCQKCFPYFVGIYTQGESLASFPGLSHLQFMIACRTGGREGLGMKLEEPGSHKCECVVNWW